MEYDGEHHFTNRGQCTRDVERWNALLHEGWTVIRVTKAQLVPDPSRLITQVRAALGKAGAPV
ncbi:very-short-patch-repair endonuclease [Hoyosella altamirensis]|uniref:Very-short-patch-repair endonuclease n=1 Tax=Hoyosella altamirensis TaxID=616997 RepID=A0A839RUL3_9ACTN|nr:very-short-patch-repair endonuclease [Hoyosella altamirensis]